MGYTDISCNNKMSDLRQLLELASEWGHEKTPETFDMIIGHIYSDNAKIVDNLIEKVTPLLMQLFSKDSETTSG